MKVGKNELIEKVVLLKGEGTTKIDAEASVKATIEAIKQLIKEGYDVAIQEFGTFEIRETNAREGRNPRTKEIIQIPASKKVAFKGSAKLKELVK